MASQRFQVDLAGIISVLSEHLYSTPTVAFRELLQNSADAIAARASMQPGHEGSVTIELIEGGTSPTLVVEDNGAVVGFAYGNWFKPRPAYRFSVEDSIYMAPEAAGKGLGRALLAELMAALERAGVRRVMAVIGDSANAGSIGVHKALGFEVAGTIPSCGWKFDRWLDIVLMQRSLGVGDGTAPEALP